VIEKEAKLTVLYKEIECCSNNNRGIVDNVVEVELRRWLAFDYRDYVLVTRMAVDSKCACEDAVETRELLDQHISDTKAIRLAIARFDELIASHPVLGLAYRKETA
jgi:hypothetical protein